MKTKQAASFFGSEAALARVLGISRQAVNKWGGVIPVKYALRIQKTTGGKLTVNWSDYQ
jgi:DNA-binding transcriptional regulator YdaS (Cro superfamily)